MKEIPQDQSSQSWLEWRKTKVTASEIPILLGKSKWCSPLVLWRRKLGFLPSQQDNYAMARGRELEPIVLAMVNEKMGTRFVPEVVQHPEIEWAAASLDGIDREHESILEIKCPSLADHKKAEDNQVPEHYKSQVQWQLFCSDVKQGYYASYHDENLVIVSVNRDDDFLVREALPAATEFYRCLIEMEEPAYSEDDYVQIIDPLFEEYAREWKSAHEMYKHYEEKSTFFKMKLVEMSDDSNCQGYGVSLKRVCKKGSIDWKGLWSDIIKYSPDIDKKYDPESYRSDQVGYWKISEQ